MWAASVGAGLCATFMCVAHCNMVCLPSHIACVCCGWAGLVCRVQPLLPSSPSGGGTQQPMQRAACQACFREQYLLCHVLQAVLPGSCKHMRPASQPQVLLHIQSSTVSIPPRKAVSAACPTQYVKTAGLQEMEGPEQQQVQPSNRDSLPAQRLMCQLLWHICCCSPVRID